MIRRAATICGGIAIVAGLVLPVAPPVGALAGQTVPVQPSAPTAALPALPYVVAWTQPVASGTLLELAIASTVVLVAGADTPLQAHALDDGRVVWKSPAGITAQLEVGGGRIFGVGGGQLHAVSLDSGQPHWAATIEEPTSGPTATADAVLISSGNELRAYRAGDGATAWRQSLGAPALWRPVVAGRLVVVALGDRHLAAFDLQTGTPAWRTRLDSAPLPLAAGEARLFLGTAAGAACAVDAHTGELEWCFQTGVPTVGAPVRDGRNVYFAQLDGMLRAFDPGSGTLGRRLPGGVITGAEPLPARPAVGPRLAGPYLVVALTTGTFALIAIDSRQPALRLSAFQSPSGQVLLAAAAAPDGSSLVSLSIEPSARRSLVGYRRQAPPPAPSMTR